MIVDENEFKARIEYARTLANYNKTELSIILKMPPSTFRRKMDHPMSLTMEEFFRLNDALPNGVLPEYLQECLGIKALKRINVKKSH